MAEFIDNNISSQEPIIRAIGMVMIIQALLRKYHLIRAAKIYPGTGRQRPGKREALFLRAFYYYDLVQHYGGVPLQLVEVTDVAGAFLPRSSADDVYAQIIKDLDSAIPLLPVAKTFPQSGKATQVQQKCCWPMPACQKAPKIILRPKPLC